MYASICAPPGDVEFIEPDSKEQEEESSPEAIELSKEVADLMRSTIKLNVRGACVRVCPRADVCMRASVRACMHTSFHPCGLVVQAQACSAARH